MLSLRSPQIGVNAFEAYNRNVTKHHMFSTAAPAAKNRHRSLSIFKPSAVLSISKPTKRTGEGHSSLLQGLGDVGDVPPSLMPWLLRFAHVNSKITGGDSNAALQEAARGIILWKMSLERGVVPDNSTLRQIISEKESFVFGMALEDVQWPAEPLRSVLIRQFSTLGVARFAAKYPAVKDSLLKGIMELIVKHYKAALGEDVEERLVDGDGNIYKTAKELMEEEEERRRVIAERKAEELKSSTSAVQNEQGQSLQPPQSKYRNPNILPPKTTTGGQQQQQTVSGSSPSNNSTDTSQQEEEEEERENEADWTPDRRSAEHLVAALIKQWHAPIQTLSKAGKAFDGLEGLLGGTAFDLNATIWNRKGWVELDALREKLEDVKELRDLVRSLGRGGGWGPLRRAPVQHLDMSGRPGLLRTTLEAQETRGLTRSDDISRLLPSEAATLARGRTVRQSKLLFFAKLAEKGLQTYERDGWSEFPTQINIDRREIRPTADRGPILLCVDTSGSMRGTRETVAKALALECMRAAKAQDRGCYVFAFAGPQEVKELELNMDAKSVNNLLDFLEKVFNGGSDFNTPIQRCLDRLTDAKWANSDILLVSDGELRQPGSEIMRKLAGAKDKLSLRIHGLIVGTPEKKRADPAVLNALCSHIIPSSGKLEVLVHEFESWASVQADKKMQFDWDDVDGNTKRREAGLKLEKLRQAEMKRRRVVQRQGTGGAKKSNNKAVRMPGKDASSFDP